MSSVLERSQRVLPFPSVRRALAFHLAAIAQTFFVESALVGFAAVSVLLIAAPRLALSGLFVSIVARVFAERAHAPRDFLATGLIELNGWFMGLACASFLLPGLSLGIALLAAGPLVAAAAIIMRRVLATWDIPLFVGPYVPAFWLLFAALSAFPWVHPSVPSVAPTAAGAAPWLVIALGGLRGVGQVFFTPDAMVGLGLAAAVSLYDRRLGLSMIAASTAAVAIGYFAQAPAWQVEQGLAGFTPALIAVGAVRGFAGMGFATVLVAVAFGTFVEASALKLSSALGLYALSSSYLLFVWSCALLRPVREAAADRRGWSSAKPHSVRIFEDG